MLFRSKEALPDTQEAQLEFEVESESKGSSQVEFQKNSELDRPILLSWILWFQKQ